MQQSCSKSCHDVFKNEKEKFLPVVKQGEEMTAYYYRDKNLKVNSCSDVHAVISKCCISLHVCF